MATSEVYIASDH